MRCKPILMFSSSLPTKVQCTVYPASATPRSLGIWEYLGSARSKILQEGARAERVKAWAAFVSCKKEKREKPSEDRVGREGQVKGGNVHV